MCGSMLSITFHSLFGLNGLHCNRSVNWISLTIILISDMIVEVFQISLSTYIELYISYTADDAGVPDQLLNCAEVY
jgi:hypothetical protein